MVLVAAHQRKALAVQQICNTRALTQAAVTPYTVLLKRYSRLRCHCYRNLKSKLLDFVTTTIAFMTYYNIAGYRAMYSTASYVFLICSCFSIFVHADAKSIKRRHAVIAASYAFVKHIIYSQHCFAIFCVAALRQWYGIAVINCTC